MLKRIPEVVAAFSAKKKSGTAISVITLAELEFGVWKSKEVEKTGAR